MCHEDGDDAATVMMMAKVMVGCNPIVVIVALTSVFGAIAVKMPATLAAILLLQLVLPMPRRRLLLLRLLLPLQLP